MSKKIAKIILTVLLALSFMFMFVFTVFLPRTTTSDYDEDLKKWPEFSWKTLFNGEYFQGITEYFTDTVHSRDKFKDNNGFIQSLYGIPKDEEVVVRPNENPDNDTSEEPTDGPNWKPSEDSDDTSQNDVSTDVSGSETSNDTSNTPGPDTSEPDDPPAPPDVELSDKVLIIGNRAMEIFYGNLYNAQIFAQTLNEFAENALQINPDLNIYSMVVPKASAYYISQSKIYGKYAKNNKENIDEINKYLSDSIRNVNAYDALDKHKDEEIFFRTDHHWTGLGAYYAAREFAKTANTGFTDLSQYDKKIRENYIGTLYKYSNYNPKLLNNPEDFVTYVPRSGYKAVFYDQKFENGRDHDLFWDIPQERKSSWYSTFLRGDRYSVKIESDTCKNGRTLLVVKDSYGNPLPVYLLDSFQTIYVVDAREIQVNLYKMVEDFEVTDVLFAESAFSAVGANYITKLKGLMK